jgi:hypothetical protein
MKVKEFVKQLLDEDLENELKLRCHKSIVDIDGLRSDTFTTYVIPDQRLNVTYRETTIELDLLNALQRMTSVCERYLEEMPVDEKNLFNDDYISPLTQAKQAINRAKCGMN